MTIDKSDIDPRRAYNLYALFGVVILLSLVPTVSGFLAFLIMATILIIMGYKYRGPKDEKDKDFNESHASFILRSIAGVSLLMSVTLTLGILYILGAIDYSAFDPCAQNIVSLGSDPAAISNDAILKLAAPCMDAFIAANKSAFITAMLITALPPLLYIGWRFVFGLSRALKSQQIEQPYKWI